MTTFQEERAKSPEHRRFARENEPQLNTPIEEMRLPARVYRCLKTAGIHTVEQILQARTSELLTIKNFGSRSLGRLMGCLRRRGIRPNPMQKSGAREADLTVLLGLPVEQSGFSESMVERLHLAQIERLGELVTKHPRDLMRFPSLGPRSIQQVAHVLNDLGLKLGMDFVAVDTAGTKWMDRIDDARIRLAEQLRNPANGYFFSKEYGVARKTLQRFLNNRPLSPYESSRLRKLFSNQVDPSRPFDLKALRSYREFMDVERIYRESGSLTRTARRLKVSHERVRQILKLGNTLKLFTYNPQKSPAHYRAGETEVTGVGV